MNIGEKVLMALAIFGILMLGAAASIGLIFGVGWVCISIIGLSSKVAGIIAVVVFLFVLILLVVFLEG